MEGFKAIFNLPPTTISIDSQPQNERRTNVGVVSSYLAAEVAALCRQGGGGSPARRRVPPPSR